MQVAIDKFGSLLVACCLLLIAIGDSSKLIDNIEFIVILDLSEIKAAQSVMMVEEGRRMEMVGQRFRRR